MVSFTEADRITRSEADNQLPKLDVAGSSPVARSFDSVRPSIDNAPAEEYFRRPGISASQLKDYGSSPLAFYLRHEVGSAPPKESAALSYGTLLHAWAEMGEEKFWDSIAVPDPSVLTATGQLGKAGKEWQATLPEGTLVVTPGDRQQLWEQTRQILANKAAARLLADAVDREFNVSFDWQGHACRCRCDGATAEKWYDLKTTREANPERTAFNAVKQWGYDIQSALYGEAAVQCGWEPHAMRFIFTSTVWPYLCAVLYLPPEVQENGRRRCLRYLSEIKQRREWGSWMPDGYGEEREMWVPDYMKGGEE